eukprot:CAMPEP_0114226000 /NCGR_PEP_ID=MMETSP0058-20121206/994_1 /TAXON_ID=36894 /ORGANISM="Pyramimonas parkeae, CCMP726" /LENGTH=279 /DNA_ID=CAMNT_0001336687 /DNA_START=134 /DNA_END=973 /DNA_ORIENTATION=-
MALESNRPMRVLLSNDDGPKSPFFAPFVEYVKNVLGWDCFVCIPDDNFSFVGKSITRSPLKVQRISPEEVHISGSPAACVNLALYKLAPDCDFVLSGPNIGHNVGRAAVLSSGTVGAAVEGVLAGRRAVAISFPFKNGWGAWPDHEIEAAVTAAGEVVNELWNNWDQHGENAELYNVNVPLGFGTSTSLQSAGDQVNGSQDARRTFVDQAAGYSSLFGKMDGDDEVYEWNPEGIKAFDHPDTQEGSDVAAVRDGLLSVTALQANIVGPVVPPTIHANAC